METLRLGVGNGNNWRNINARTILTDIISKGGLYLKCLQARVNCTENGGHMQRIFTILGYCLHYPGIPVTVAGHFFGFQIKMCQSSFKNQSISHHHFYVVFYAYR